MPRAPSGLPSAAARRSGTTARWGAGIGLAILLYGTGHGIVINGFLSGPSTIASQCAASGIAVGESDINPQDACNRLTAILETFQADPIWNLRGSGSDAYRIKALWDHPDLVAQLDANGADDVLDLISATGRNEAASALSEMGAG